MNDLCLKKSKLNLINFNEINIFRNRAKFENTLLVCISNFKSMRLFKIFDNNIVSFFNCFKQCFFRDYYLFVGYMDFHDDELKKEKFSIKLRGFFLLVQYAKIIARHELNKPRGFRQIKKLTWFIPKQFINIRKKIKAFIVLLEDFIFLVQRYLARRSDDFSYYKKIKAQLELPLYEEHKQKNSIYLKWLKKFLIIF